MVLFLGLIFILRLALSACGPWYWGTAEEFKHCPKVIQPCPWITTPIIITISMYNRRLACLLICLSIYLWHASLILFIQEEYFSKSWDLFSSWVLTLTGWMVLSNLLDLSGSQFLCSYNNRVIVLQSPLETFLSLKLPLLHSGNLSNLSLHIFYNMPLRLWLLTYHMLAY